MLHLEPTQVYRLGPWVVELGHTERHTEQRIGARTEKRPALRKSSVEAAKKSDFWRKIFAFVYWPIGPTRGGSHVTRGTRVTASIRRLPERFDLGRQIDTKERER